MTDDFTFTYGGVGITIGRYVHSASFVSVIRGGELRGRDRAAVACGARIVTASDTYKSGKRVCAALLLDHRNVVRGVLAIGRDAFIEPFAGHKAASVFLED